ncbi:hypothetical protein PYH37_006355 (plasmid) [Sinorhizobium numidicum]|uniref:Uncharacterized protein n=1 Tax=Sinorhizobium numidicum TaxID=680248 RepID=A0ABY8D7V9_9HYPH|nr:hypothetical protein [Sinorhizobium numidicum]WEX79444.1 hypothetical protein PYH37_006355 [Sinorhizobium numidicum]WEX85600.1 hypothetical protein PYH38_006029 [Sinorhizobium numidicum]
MLSYSLILARSLGAQGGDATAIRAGAGARLPICWVRNHTD